VAGLGRRVGTIGTFFPQLTPLASQIEALMALVHAVLPVSLFSSEKYAVLPGAIGVMKLTLQLFLSALMFVKKALGPP
jgi:hypothetical protein